MNVMGQLRVLSDDQMQIVHDKACELLWEKGITFEADSTIEILKKHGVKVEDHTAYFTKDLVEKCLEQVPKEFTVEAPNHARDVKIGGNGIAIHPAGGEVFMADYNGNRHKATRQDFIDLQKVYQACENVDIAGYQPISPMDIPERTKGLYMTLDSFKYSDKPILAAMELETIEKKKEVFDLYDIAFGKGYLDEHYVTWHCVCPNSPFFFSNFCCEGIEMFASHNQPVLLVSAPMSGISAPVYLLSTIILALTESLAGLVLAQLIKPGIPVIMSASLTYGYMRSASWECASPDTALMLAAIVQMDRQFYGLPARAQCGVTSSKCVDFQAGMETMQSFLWCAAAGVNITSQTVGALADLLTCSLEKVILDDELISRVRYMMNGLKFDEEQMCWDDLMAAKPLDNFLLSESTMMHFREFWAPTISDWTSVDEWENAGKKHIDEIAHARVQKILADAPDSLLDPEAEKEMLGYIKHVESTL